MQGTLDAGAAACTPPGSHPVEHAQRREQRRRSMTHVVMRDAFNVAEPQRKQRLGALQGLALALFVDAQHESILGRAQIQADDIAQLVDEEGIGGDLEALGAMRCSPRSSK